MSDLRIYRDLSRKPLVHAQNAAAINEHMNELGAVFGQFSVANEPPDSEAGQDEIIEAHRELLNALMLEYAFASIDVLNVTQDYPHLEKLLAQFQSEHRHPETEARLFIAGGGCFYLRARDRIYAVTCQPGDFISLPANLYHWYEMDTSAPLCVVRLYSSAQGCQTIPVGRNKQHTTRVSR